MADMLVAGMACRTVAAMVERAHDHLLADSHAPDTVSDSGDGARHLMADHALEADPRVHVPVEDMHVRAADAAIGDAHSDLSRRRRGRLCRFNGKLSVAAVEGGADGLFGQNILLTLRASLRHARPPACPSRM